MESQFSEIARKYLTGQFKMNGVPSLARTHCRSPDMLCPRSSRHVLFALQVLCLVACIPSVLCLWPMPRLLENGSTPLILSSSFTIDIQIPDTPADLKEAASRTQSYLKNDKLERLVPDRGASDAALLHGAHQLKSLRLTLSKQADKAQSISAEAILPIGVRSEEYTLTIPASGAAATISANSTLGLFRGLTTFEQLWYTVDDAVYTLEAPISIVDSPAFVS